MSKGERIVKISIEEEMKSAYIDYSMSVIVSRAIPDVRDGMKPVHRRVLFGMKELGLVHNKAHKKSARIVGEVLGKYHPHGDSSVYNTMVRMAQPWSLRYPLVDGQGNFGSVDGDSPAAMRYTEARLEKVAEDLITDIDKDTVDHQLNFDDTLEEPTVLPTRIPNLLVNGSSGIAVGMATNILPHNLSEVVDGMKAYIDNPDITVADLMQHVKAPDFPTGGTIFGYEGVKEAFETGRGKIVVRGKATFNELPSGREQIIITEIPYQVNKASLIEKAAELVNEKRIEGISDIRDESDRDGMRIVFDLKRDAIGNVVLNKLFRYTPLQTSYGVNNVALVNGRPELLNLRDMVHHFIDFRHEVVVRRTKYDLKKAEDRAHILEGLIIASDNIDEVIKLIRASKDTESARNALIERFELSEIQARAIVEMRLRQLTGLEQDKLRAEYDEVMKRIEYLKSILESRDLRMQIIKDELDEVKEAYGDERRTNIEFSGADIDITDLIPDDNVVITISHMGYIKRTPSTEFKAQNRGGTGSKGSSTRDKDFIEYMFTATSHNYLLLFTEQGRCFWLKVYEIPEGTKTSKGRAIQNLIQIPQDDKVMAFIPIVDLTDDEFLDNHYMFFATKKGRVKKTILRDYSRPRSNGVNAITIKEGDELLRVVLTTGESQIVLGTKQGQAIRFEESTVRGMGRTAAGVIGIRMDDSDEVVGMMSVTEDEEATVLVVSEKGYGKRTFLDDPETGEPNYRITNRGGKGVRTLNITDKTGKMIGLRHVSDDDDLMIINRSGITIRTAVEDISTLGRATQGVRLINVRKKDEIAAIAVIRGGKQLREEEEANALKLEQHLENQEGEESAENDGETDE